MGGNDVEHTPRDDLAAPEREPGLLASLTGDRPEPGSGPAAPAAPPDWWHRDHPVFTALTGFFTGLVTVALLPAIFYALLRGLTSERTAEEAFPFVLLFFAVPLAMIVFPSTRRFGRYLLFGMLVTLLVVFGVGTFVFWLMLRNST